MKCSTRNNRRFFLRVPLFLGLLTCILMVALMTSTGCSQAQGDKAAESEKPAGTVSPGATGTGTLADEKDQKLPLNPEDYKPMPFPSVKPNLDAQEGENPQEPSIQGTGQEKTSKQGESDKQ